MRQVGYLLELCQDARSKKNIKFCLTDCYIITYVTQDFAASTFRRVAGEENTVFTCCTCSELTDACSCIHFTRTSCWRIKSTKILAYLYRLYEWSSLVTHPIHLWEHFSLLSARLLHVTLCILFDCGSIWMESLMFHTAWYLQCRKVLEAYIYIYIYIYVYT
jgi:hypothetical protein